MKNVDLTPVSPDPSESLYAELLREHISKEDTILYPLAERVIPEAMRAEITDGYRQAEARSDAGFSERYRKLVEGYE